MARKPPPKKSASKSVKKTAPSKKAAPFGKGKPKIPALGGAGLMGLGGTGAQGMLP
jgi:hypothetical protein